MNYHTEDCQDYDCNGECHGGELECLECGEIWEGEWEDAPEVCPECGEPWNDAESDAELRALERKQMGITNL